MRCTVLGGALLAEDLAKQNGPPKMNGSVMVINASNLEEARERMEKDIYATGEVLFHAANVVRKRLIGVIGGAWDMSKAQYYPVVVAKH
jgi:hypothetical protein